MVLAAFSRPMTARPKRIVPLAVLASAALLWFFPPETSTFYPLCPFHEATGLLCPGCGATRALAALLHGRLEDAIHWNALVVCLIPALAVYLFAAFFRSQVRRSTVWPVLPRVTIVLLVGVALGFAVVRNLR